MRCSCAGRSNRFDNGTLCFWPDKGRPDVPQQPNAPRPHSTPHRLPPDRRTGSGFARAIGAFVPKATSAAFARFGFHSAEIMSSWPRIAGEDVAAIARPLSIRWPRGSAPEPENEKGRRTGATLTLACEAAFALDISYRTQQIIDRVNRYFGYAAIAQLRVVQSAESAPALSSADAPAAPVVPRKNASDLPQALEMLGESIKCEAARRAARSRS